MNTFNSAEEAVAFIQAAEFGGSVELSISDALSFRGSVDTIGAGMAIVLDAMLAKGYEPDGFEQGEGYRVYRYKPFA